VSTSTSRHGSANPRASLAAFFSFLLPGLGQAYNGQLRLAWILLAPVLLLAGAIVLTFLLAGSGLLSRMFDPRFLIGLIVLDVVLLGWRLLAIVQAHGLRERPNVRHWTTYATGAVVVLTLVMHLVPAYYAAKAIDTLGAVSQENQGGQSYIPGFSGLPEPSQQPDVGRGERVNILLVGVDALPGRVTQLTDTMMVVSLDPAGGPSAMISIPRDTYGAPLPGGGRFNEKLNALMTVANQDPARYPDGGVSTLKQTIGKLLGIDIHYFAAINLLGFKEAVDSIGGVDITVKRPIADPGYFDENNRRTGFFLDAGRQHMNGHVALGFVRSRHGAGDNDFTRADRQQQLLTAMRAKLTAGNLLTALPGLLDAVKHTIITDVPRDQIPQLAQVVQDADVDHLERIVLQPPQYYDVSTQTAAGYILLTKLGAIKAKVDRMLRDLPDPTETQAPTRSPAP
jgi:polyisoprenyl-teichoic acid--peptidoglycan teichoic acid transferase